MAQEQHERMDGPSQDPAAPPGACVAISAAVLVASFGLLFFRLGHYPLWCDETDTAFYARGIARTGDTYVRIDHNLYAFRWGSCLSGLHGRYMPPASFYLAAPFVGREGTSAFWPRFPFAMCGALSIALMLFWLWRDGASPLFWTLMSIGLLTNVSQFLFFRQSRYYALATLLSLAAVYCYLHWDGRRAMLIAFSFLAALLMLTHYVAYAALMLGLVTDYAVFGRKDRSLSRGNWALLIVPQMVLAVITLSIWNPLNKDVAADLAGRNWLTDRFTLLCWNLRDLNASEFGVVLLLLAAPLLYFVERNRWLLRGSLAILSYALAVALVSPQPLGRTWFADVRYLSPLIPLCIALACLAILILSRRKWALALPVALVAFGTNVLNRPWEPTSWRSTPVAWVAELAADRTTATQQTIDWINEHVQPGQSIWSWPDITAYTLMYHAPQAVYAWQLQPAALEQYKDLPPILFVGQTPPDFLIEFGNQQEDVRNTIASYEKHRGVHYERVAKIDAFWNDLTRPELFWRSFTPKQDFDHDHDGVTIWRRSDVVPMPAMPPR